MCFTKLWPVIHQESSGILESDNWKHVTENSWRIYYNLLVTIGQQNKPHNCSLKKKTLTTFFAPYAKVLLYPWTIYMYVMAHMSYTHNMTDKP